MNGTPRTIAIVNINAKNNAFKKVILKSSALSLNFLGMENARMLNKIPIRKPICERVARKTNNRPSVFPTNDKYDSGLVLARKSFKDGKYPIF